MGSKPRHLNPTAVTTRRVVTKLEEQWKCIELRAIENVDPVNIQSRSRLIAISAVAAALRCQGHEMRLCIIFRVLVIHELVDMLSSFPNHCSWLFFSTALNLNVPPAIQVWNLSRWRNQIIVRTTTRPTASRLRHTS